MKSSKEHQSAPYNPLDKKNLGDSVANALLRVEVRPLSDTSHVGGAGVYALYYTGDFPPYSHTRNTKPNFIQPIYVGKAIPEGGRKGGLGFDAGRGKALQNRLRQHFRSTTAAVNLDESDFHYRALPVEDIWIPLGENVLIEMFQPLWNRVIDGFGNNDPGGRRATQYRSAWDVLHPGRKWAEKLASNPNLSMEAIVSRIDAFYEGRLPESELVTEDGSH